MCSVSPGLKPLPSQSSVRLELRCAYRREATERSRSIFMPRAPSGERDPAESARQDARLVPDRAVLAARLRQEHAHELPSFRERVALSLLHSLRNFTVRCTRVGPVKVSILRHADEDPEFPAVPAQSRLGADDVLPEHRVLVKRPLRSDDPAKLV